MKHVLLALTLAMAPTLVSAQDADQAESDPQVFEYWWVAAYDDTPGTEAYTWVGAQDGVAGEHPTAETAPAVLTVYFEPTADGACTASAEVSANPHFPLFEVVELQVGEQTLYDLNLPAETSERTTTHVVVPDETLEEVLAAFIPAETARVNVYGWETETETVVHIFPLIGFTASTNAARARCEEQAQAAVDDQ